MYNETKEDGNESKSAQPQCLEAARSLSAPARQCRTALLARAVESIRRGCAIVSHPAFEIPFYRRLLLNKSNPSLLSFLSVKNRCVCALDPLRYNKNAYHSSPYHCYLNFTFFSFSFSTLFFSFSPLLANLEHYVTTRRANKKHTVSRSLFSSP